jgi:GNAT superfamily N-acetyltransferase
MDEPIVRRATVSDVSELAELRREFTYEDPPPGGSRPDFEEAFAASIQSGISDGSWVVWVAEAEGELVAHAFVAVVPKVPRPVESAASIGYLTNVYTRPGWRSRGVGGRILEAVTSWAQKAGLELLIVWPSDDSVAFYRRHGFGSDEQPLVWMNPDL